MIPAAFARAQDAFEAGDTVVAARELAAALAENPDCAWCHYLAGQMAARRGDLALAEREYRRTVALDATTSAHHDLADLALEREDFAQARAEYALDLRSHPECAEARLNLAALELRAGHRAEAARQYQLSLTYHPDDRRAKDGLERARDFDWLIPLLVLAAFVIATPLLYRWRKHRE